MNFVKALEIALIAMLTFATACIVCQSFLNYLKRRKLALNVEERSQPLVVSLAFEISKVFVALVNRLKNFKKIQSISNDLNTVVISKKINRSSEEILSLVLLAEVVVFFLSLLLFHSIAFSCAFCLLLAILPSQKITNSVDKLSVEMREEVPVVLRSMISEASAGLSLSQIIDSTYKSCKGPLRRIFEQVLNKMRLGSTTAQALDVLKNTATVPELKFVAVALEVQHTSGGAIVPILESAMKSVSDDIELLRSLKVQTAQAKMSAAIVVCMPFVLLTAFSFMSPGFLKPFFSSILGILLFGFATLLQTIGILSIKKILAKGQV